jgi:hypothetical protein
MRKHNLFLMVVLTIIPTAVLTAQPTLKLFKPPPGQYSLEQLWRARVSNPGNTTYESWFEGFVFEETQGQVFYARTKKFQLLPGTRIYMYRDVQIEHSEHAPGYELFAAQLGGLPAGTYTFVLLLNSFGISDTVEFEVRPMSPPRSILPRDRDTVTVPFPEFVWTTPNPPSPGVTYDLKLAEVMDGETPEEALLANRPWFEEKELRGTSRKYPTSAPKLENGDYAWTVTAFAADGQTATSDVRSFTLLPGGAACMPWITEATIVWQHQGASGWEIWYADFSKVIAPMVSAPKLLYPMVGSNMDPAVAYDRSGNTWAVWSHCDPGAGQHYRILWSRRMAGQSNWSAPQAVGAPDGFGQEQLDPALAFDDNGKGFCFWIAAHLTPVEAPFLAYSFWDGSGWSATPTELWGCDTCRLPEITFTAALTTGLGAKTPHRAVAIVARSFGLPHGMDSLTWDGYVWSSPGRLPSPGDAVWQPYAYLGNIPAQDHVSIAALRPPIQNCFVTAAWTRKTPTVNAKLLACNGLFSAGTWTWQTWPNWFGGPGGTTYRDPAVAIDGNNKAQNVFCGNNRIYCKHGFGACELLTPPATGSRGRRPAVACVTGTYPGTLAAWFNPNNHRLMWTFWNYTAWTLPLVLQSGRNRNPDVAARSGSHTMPVH